MKTRLVNYKLPVELIAEIKEMSEGNNTALVVDLLKQAIAMRNVESALREGMYMSAKEHASTTRLLDSHIDIRNLIDGLHI
tara:strand:+ start:577 stop:819 length:243 start_codon:yes stop_codon:yes gene_type:complete